jgi:Xylose isomerase-like TIM barrel
MYGEHYGRILEENLGFLNEHSGKVLITIENVKFEPYMFRPIDQALNDESNVRLCLDIPKLLDSSYQPEKFAMDMYEEHARYVSELHLHDIIHPHGQHFPLEYGLIRWSQYRSWIARKDIWKTIEVRPVTAAAKSLAWLKETLALSDA